MRSTVIVILTLLSLTAPAARAMQRTPGIAGTIYIGAGQSEDTSDEKFAAHAWLKCGDAFVTGEAGHERYAIIGVVSW